MTLAFITLDLPSAAICMVVAFAAGFVIGGSVALSISKPRG